MRPTSKTFIPRQLKNAITLQTGDTITVTTQSGALTRTITGTIAERTTERAGYSYWAADGQLILTVNTQYDTYGKRKITLQKPIMHDESMVLF